MKPLALGDKVMVSGKMTRRYLAGANDTRIWEPSLMPAQAGIVVGKRNLRDTRVCSYDPEYGFEYTVVKSHSVWLVAYAMNRAPMYVHDQDLELIT